MSKFAWTRYRHKNALNTVRKVDGRGSVSHVIVMWRFSRSLLLGTLGAEGSRCVLY
jgi:hypothetical protein